MLSTMYRQVYHVGRRCLWTNSVSEEILLRYKYDFVTDKLASELRQNGVNPDDIDRLYNHQLQDDHEFNNRALPRQDSPLWGYVYGTQLARLQNQLQNLTSEQEFLRGHLEVGIKELVLKMQRYYPDLNCEGTESEEQANDIMDNIEARISAQYIANDPQKYIEQAFGNNWFIEEFDEDDKYNVYLPRKLEDKLVSCYQYDWDSANGTVRPQYLEMLNELEKGLSPKVDALKGLLLPSLESFLMSLASDPNKRDMLANVVLSLEKCSSIIADAAGGKDVGGKLLDVLFGGNSKINAAGAQLLADIFGCTPSAFAGKTREEAASVLSTFDDERVAAVYKAAQARAALKSESLTKLLLTVLLNTKPQLFAPFATGTVPVAQFLSDNEAAIDQISGALLNQQKLQKQATVALKAVVNSLATSLEEKGVARNVTGDVVMELLSKSTVPSMNLGSSVYESMFQSAVTRDDVVEQIDCQVMMEYLETAGQQCYELCAINNIVMPSSEGLDGILVSDVATALSTNEFTLFDDITEFLRANGMLTADNVRSTKSDLMIAADDSFSNLKAASKELIQGQQSVKNAVLLLKLQYDEGFDFQRIKNTYNPLDVVLHADNV